MKALLLPHRVDAPELLDEGNVSDTETRRSLEDLRRLNHWLLGVYATLRPLKAWLHELDRVGTVLDLGTGSGQLAQALTRWSVRTQWPIRVVALDFAPRHLHHARRWSQAEGTLHIALLAGDALRLPLADGSVDFVTSSLFLHHFDAPQLAQLFTECRRVARHGVAMSDLWRHPLPFGLYKSLAEPLFVRSPVTRADSTTSFRRAYRPAEIARLAAPHLPAPQVRLDPSLRWVLTSRW